ncbi:hypothetical protein V3564_00945 [Bartonella sp. B12(2025)]
MKEQKAILFVDNMAGTCLLLIQVPQKHLKTSSGLVTEIISLPRILKTLTHCVLVAYSDFVGCGYTIQYPFRGKCNDGLDAVFLSTRHSS